MVDDFKEEEDDQTAGRIVNIHTGAPIKYSKGDGSSESEDDFSSEKDDGGLNLQPQMYTLDMDPEEANDDFEFATDMNHFSPTSSTSKKRDPAVTNSESEESIADAMP